MSDWYAARSTHRTATAGLDLVMPGPDGPWAGKLVAAVRDGEVGESVVDEKVLRPLRLAAPCRRPGRRVASPTAEPWPEEAVAAELRATAAAGFVLVRNAEVDGAPLLPLEAPALRAVPGGRPRCPRQRPGSPWPARSSMPDRSSSRQGPTWSRASCGRRNGR